MASVGNLSSLNLVALSITSTVVIGVGTNVIGSVDEQFDIPLLSTFNVLVDIPTMLDESILQVIINCTSQLALSLGQRFYW